MLDEQLVEEASEITMTDYSDSENEIEKAEAIIEELILEIKYLNEKIDDIVRDRDDNYKHIPYEDML